MIGLWSDNLSKTVSVYSLKKPNISKCIFANHLGTFNHWKAGGAAVFLKNQIVLTPELFSTQGLVYAKNVSLSNGICNLTISYQSQTFSLENFKFEVDLSISNKQRSSMARGDFRLFILRDNPMKSASEFGHGLDGDYDGVQIHLREGAERNTDK